MDKVESAAESLNTTDRNESTDRLDQNAPSRRRKTIDKFHSCVSPLLLSQHPRIENPTKLQKLKYSLLLPPHGVVGDTLTMTMIILILWAVLYSVLGDLALPTGETIPISVEGGAVFTVILLLITAIIGGKLVQVVHLPPLLGMLLVGMLLANVPVVKTVGRLDSNWSSVIRSTALVVILIRAGLGLDPEKLKKLSLMVFRLAFLPCLMESCVVAVASKFILGLPWLWGFMLGFVLSAVSPAVVVPCLLSLQSRGLGVDKGVPTLVIAAASIDDVLAISCFTILLGVTFNPSDDIARTVLQGPIEVIVGIIYGVVSGILCTYLPPSSSNTGQRLVMVVGAGLLALFGLPHLDLPGAGPLAVLVMAFVVGLGWRRQGWGDDNEVTRQLASGWLVLQPLLFSLIGAEVDVEKLDTNVLGLAVLVICLGLIIRLLISQLAVLGGDLNMKERIFVSFAWLPKATVQAAIGPYALDKAKNLLATSFSEYNCLDISRNVTNTQPLNVNISNADLNQNVPGLIEACDMLEYGNIVLTVAVAVIIITAPIGAAAIMLSGPKLLTSTNESQNK